jgi:hypothetical protein
MHAPLTADRQDVAELEEFGVGAQAIHFCDWRISFCVAACRGVSSC